jgi:3-deoxy-7-phosphoheptulonate synthase
VDPSHGTGKRDKVHPMALAAVAAGASGLIVEVHPNPDRAMSDGYQSLYPDQFRELADECRAIADLLNKRRATAAEAKLAPA